MDYSGTFRRGPNQRYITAHSRIRDTSHQPYIEEEEETLRRRSTAQERRSSTGSITNEIRVERASSRPGPSGHRNDASEALHARVERSHEPEVIIERPEIVFERRRSEIRHPSRRTAEDASYNIPLERRRSSPPNGYDRQRSSTYRPVPLPNLDYSRRSHTRYPEVSYLPSNPRRSTAYHDRSSSHPHREHYAASSSGLSSADTEIPNVIPSAPRISSRRDTSPKVHIRQRYDEEGGGDGGGGPGGSPPSSHGGRHGSGPGDGGHGPPSGPKPELTELAGEPRGSAGDQYRLSVVLCVYRNSKRGFDYGAVELVGLSNQGELGLVPDLVLFRRFRTCYERELRGWIRKFFSFKSVTTVRLLQFGDGQFFTAEQVDDLFAANFMKLFWNPSRYLSRGSLKWNDWIRTAKHQHPKLDVAFELREDYQAERIVLGVGFGLVGIVALTVAWLIEGGDPGYVSTVMSYVLTFIAATIGLTGIWDWFDGETSKQIQEAAVMTMPHTQRYPIYYIVPPTGTGHGQGVGKGDDGFGDDDDAGDGKGRDRTVPWGI